MADSPIYLLPAAPTLTGTERVPIDKEPFGVAGSTTYTTPAAIATYLNGLFINGNLTPNYVPVASAVKTLVDSRINHTPTIISFYTGSSSFSQTTGSNILTTQSGSNSSFLVTGTNQTNVQWNNGTVSSGLDLDVSTAHLRHTSQIIISTPSIYVPSLTANRVIITNGGSVLTASTVTSGDLLNITGGTSNFQIQINSKMTNPMIDIGDMIQGTTAGTPVRIAAVVTGNALISGGVSSPNSWGKIGLTTHVTGILPVINGGTGKFTYNLGDLLVGTVGSLTTLGIGTAGQVLTVSGGTAIWQTPSGGGGMANPMTTTGDIIQANPGITPTRLGAVAAGNVLISGGVATINSWGKVGLTTHISGVLPIANGGTNKSTYNLGDLLVGTAGSLTTLSAGTAGQVLTIVAGTAAWVTPSGGGGGITGTGIAGYLAKWTGTSTQDSSGLFQSSGKLGLNTTVPLSNFHIKSTTLSGLYLEMVSGSGPAGLEINTVNTIGAIINSGTSIGIQVYGSGGGYSYTGNGKGLSIDSAVDNGIESYSFATAGFFNQAGILIANNINPTVGIYRTLNLTSFDATAPLLDINDTTASTGNLASFSKAGVAKVVIKNTGILQYIDGNQASGKVLTSDASGNATWQTGGGGGSYTFSTGLTNTASVITANLSTGVSGGQTAIGGTANSNNLILTSTSAGTKGFIVFGTSVYDEANNRLGIATGSVAGIYDITLGPNSGRTIGMGRGTAGGQSLTLTSGSAVLAGTNFNAGTLQLSTGTSTGNGTGSIEFWISGGGSAGTADTAPTKRAHIIGNGNWTIGTNSTGAVSTPAARMDVFSAHGTYILRLNNSSLSGNIGWSFENETNSGNNNLIINEHTSTPATLQRFKWVAGGRMLIGTGSTADANLHINGNFKLVDTTQGNGKVLTSDANGLASWQTPAAGFSNPMTTIGDIIQANTGGTPQRLGNSTTGTYLRSVSGGLNVWSTLVLPNSAATDQLFYATGTDVMGSSAELTYSSSAAQFQVSKSTTYLSSVLNNTSTGTTSTSAFRINNSFTSMEIGLTSSGFTGTIAGVAVGSNETYITSGSGGFHIFGSSTNYFYAGSNQILSYNVIGLGIRTGGGANSYLELGAGSTTTAPMAFNSGSLITTLEDGSIEYDGANFYITRLTPLVTREIVLAGTVQTGTFTPSTTQVIRVNIGGTNYNLVTAP